MSGTLIRIGPVAVRVRARTVVTGIAILVVLALFVLGSLVIGATQHGLADLPAVLTGEARPSVTRSVLGRRLPRALTAALVGALLGMSGAVFQSLSRNALGSPDIIGFTSGAATAAVFQIVVLGGGMLQTAVAAVLGGLLTAVLVYLLARRDGITGGLRLVLVGIGVGAVVSALSSLLIARADLDDALLAQLWSAGSLTGRGWTHVAALAVVAGLAVPALLALSRGLAILEMGDDSAHGVGVPAERLRFGAMVIAVVIAAAATAAAGPIAFVAFAAGQIARRLLPVPGVLVGTAGLIGAALLVGADLLAQHLDLGMRTPVGLVTSLLGGLYLLWLLARRI